MTTALLIASLLYAADGDFVKDLGDQGTAEIVAVGETPTGPWWAPDGTPLEADYVTFPPSQSGPAGDIYRTLIVRVGGEEGTDLVLGAVPNETAKAESAPSSVQLNGETQPGLKGLIIFVESNDAPFEPRIRGVVGPWEHGYSTVPSRWRTEDVRAKVSSVDQLPIFIVRPLGATTAVLNVLHPKAGVLVRTSALTTDGEIVPGEGTVNGPLLRQVDGKMQESEDISAIQSAFNGGGIDTLKRIRIDFRKTEWIAFPGVAENPK